MRLLFLIFLSLCISTVSVNAKIHHHHHHHKRHHVYYVHHKISVNHDDYLTVNDVLPDQKNKPRHYTGTISIDEYVFPYATGGAGRGSAPYGTFPIRGIHTYGPYPLNSFALGSKKLRIPDPKYPYDPRAGILIHPGRDINVKHIISEGCLRIPNKKFPVFKSVLLKKINREGPQFLTINRDGTAVIVSHRKPIQPGQTSDIKEHDKKIIKPIEENKHDRIVKTALIQKPIIIKQRTSTLTTFVTVSGHKLTVATHLVSRWDALVADFVAAGYRPRHISCFAKGGHIPNSRHYYGAACDFDQYGRGLTVPFMYHAHSIIVKHGFRDGCDFNDCGHVDDGLSSYHRRQYRQYRRQRSYKFYN